VTLPSQNDRGDGEASILCLTLLCPNARQAALARSLEHVHRLVGLYHAIFQVRQPHIWGEATTTCASDSTQFGAWDQNLMTEWHLRYGGKGVMIYWHLRHEVA
jgi:TnpA family transposase